VHGGPFRGAQTCIPNADSQKGAIATIRNSEQTVRRPVRKVKRRRPTTMAAHTSRPEGVDRVGAEPIRVVVAKPGLDGHDRGVKIVARALRDAGMEVVYLGLRQTPEMIVETAIQEDADAVGLSILSGAHMTLFPRVVELLRQRGAGDVLVFGGGIVPAEDIAELKRLGVAEIFTPGAPTTVIVEWLRAAVGAGARADVAD
jgi:methylmalonyl-CoA mutase C-terminal domain/subunit